MQRWNGWASAAESSHLQPLLHQGSTKTSTAKMAPGLQLLLRTRVCPLMIFQVSSGGEPFATVFLLADERLLAVVRAHVNLEPLQHVEALPAALGPAPEHPVVPWRREQGNVGVCRIDVWRLQAGHSQKPEQLAVPAKWRGYLCVLRWYLRWAGQVNVLQQPSNEQRRICLESGRPLWGARSPSPVRLCVWSPRQPETEK